MPRPITQRGRRHALLMLAPLEIPLPIPADVRDGLAQQSIEAMKQAEAAGVNDVKQHTNPAAVPR